MEQIQDSRNRQYFNDGQMLMLMLMPRDLVAVCGRGFGKGVVQAKRIQTAFQGMPGSMGGFVSPSVKRCLTNILPSMLIHLERWGFHRDMHYIVGRRPPKALHWKDPLFTPANYENTISFYNGSCINIISQDRTGTSNSMSLDYLVIDEAKFIDYEQLKNETFQANRGNQMYFGKFYMHHGMTITSDMPMTKAGSWFLKYKDMMDPELVEVMKGILHQIWALNQKMKSSTSRHEAYRQRIEQLQAQLDEFRQRCLFYAEYTSIDNLAILGEDYIHRMKRELPPLTFATSVMSKRVGISMDGFYSSIDPKVNYYTAPNENRLNLETMNKGDITEDCRLDSDLDPNAPLLLAFDANSNINWMVVGQVVRNKLKVIKSFFVKYERKMPELIDDFSNYYRYHRRRSVVVYFDSTFVGNNYAMSDIDFSKNIRNLLKEHGWTVKSKYIGRPMQHILKCELINRMFRGRANLQVLINRDNNVDLIISIESAGIYDGKKDKRGEKLAETEEDKLEGRTDGSDAFDTLCIGAERFPVAAGSGVTANYFG